MKSILPPDLTGVMFIAGYRGTGKTILATQADLPENIVLFDLEDKGKMYDGQLNFGYYVAISQKSNRPVDKADMMLKEIEALPEDKFTVAVLDNITPLEEGLEAIVLRDAKKYGEAYTKDVANIIKDSYGTRRGIAYSLIHDAIVKPLYAKGIRLVIATSHVKPRYNTPGKMDIKGKEKWQELSILSLILMRGDKAPIPSAIRWKEQLSLNELVIPKDATDELLQAIMRGEQPSHNVTCRLPYRIPICDWQHIRYYLYHPADLENPAEGEKLDLEEASVFDDKLSKEQIAIQLLMLQKQAEENKMLELAELQVQNEQLQEVQNRVKELAGTPLPMVLKQIKSEIAEGTLQYDNDITMGQVAKWMNGE